MTLEQIEKIVSDTMNILETEYDAPLSSFGYPTVSEIATRIYSERFGEKDES